MRNYINLLLLMNMLCGNKNIKETIEDKFKKLEEDECNDFIEECMLTQCKIDGLSGLLLSKRIHEKESLKDFEYIIEKFEEVIRDFKNVYELKLKEDK